jgi:hypothetical protein
MRRIDFTLAPRCPAQGENLTRHKDDINGDPPIDNLSIGFAA